MAPAKTLLYLLENTVISCENSVKGCSAKFHYKNQLEFSEHVSEKCPYKNVLCPNHRCGKEFMKKDLEQHMEECKAELIDCEFCGEMLAREKIKGHIEEFICSNICKWCNKRYLLSEEPNHPEECEFMIIVCLRCKGILYKREFESHKLQCHSNSLRQLNFGTHLDRSLIYHGGNNSIVEGGNLIRMNISCYPQNMNSIVFLKRV